jgi:hypothetical protein
MVEIMNGSACIIHKRSIEEQRFVKWDEEMASGKNRVMSVGEVAMKPVNN